MHCKAVCIFSIFTFFYLSACSDNVSSEKNPLISEDTSLSEINCRISSSSSVKLSSNSDKSSRSSVKSSSSTKKSSSSDESLSNSTKFSCSSVESSSNSDKSSSSKDGSSSSSEKSSSSSVELSSSSEKSSSSSAKSSSSSDKSSSSSAKSSSSSEKSSSSSAKSSSSSDKSSSSSVKSSSSSDKSSSSSVKSSSSSAKSSSSSLGIPFEIYDCSEYKCVTTIHLNSNVEYGEYLDDRLDQNIIYKTVKIGEQEWFAQNLNYNKKGSICPLEVDSLCDLYGRLYRWEDAINACPSGWKLPDADDYKKLNDFVENNGSGLPAGTYLKYGENNIWGFSGVFAGFRTRIGADSEYGIYGYFWTSTEVEDKAKGRILVKNKDYFGYVTEYKEAMLSVRCIKD